MGVGQGDATTSLIFRINGLERLQLYCCAVQRPNEASKRTPQLVSHVFHAEITFAMLEYDTIPHLYNVSISFLIVSNLNHFIVFKALTIYNSSQSGLKQVINDEFFAPSLITSRLRVSYLSSTSLRKKTRISYYFRTQKPDGLQCLHHYQQHQSPMINSVKQNIKP